MIRVVYLLQTVHKISYLSLMLRLKNASFEIVPADSGVFEVSAKFMGIPMEKVEIVFQVSYKQPPKSYPVVT